MNNPTSRRLVWFCALLALLTAATAAAGIFLRGDGAFEAVVSVRGEPYEMATSGVYAWNAARVVAEGIGWDIFTLLFAVPALLIALPALRRGSLRARLFAIGLCGYLFYQYLMYAVTWAFGPLFLPFVLIYSLSLVGMGWMISTISLAELPGAFSARFPRRSMAILCFVLAAVLLAMWLPLIANALRGDLFGKLHGQTTFVVQALDLGLIVPLALFTGIAAWRGWAVGYLLCSTLVVKAFAMAAAICAMLLSAAVVEGTLEVPPFLIFAAAALLSAWLGAQMYRSVQPLVQAAPHAT
jgi:hypothetical protein